MSSNERSREAIAVLTQSALNARQIQTQGTQADSTIVETQTTVATTRAALEDTRSPNNVTHIPEGSVAAAAESNTRETNAPHETRSATTANAEATSARNAAGKLFPLFKKETQWTQPFWIPCRASGRTPGSLT